MKRFTNILVGVNLSAADRLVCDELGDPTEEALQRALWLARLNSARVRFLYSLEVCAQTEILIEENHDTRPSLVEQAKAVLEKLVARAKGEGVAADSQVAIGKSWVQIIRQVLRGKHDLVVVGSRDSGSVKSFLVGGTGIKLLRKCPCPVWVTQPQDDRKIASILVAHDLHPVGDLALELGCAMAQLHDAQLHVLHAEESPELESFLPEIVSADRAAEHHAKAKEHIASQLSDFPLGKPAQVHFAKQPPDVAIMDHIQRHRAELLVMGTVARAGLPGLITGNTAERLLPQIPCSVLAVKPEGFTSPVTLDE